MSSGIVIVGKYRYDYEAEIARASLEAEGIEAEVLSDSAGAMLPSTRQLNPIRLAVHSDNAELARQILTQPGAHTSELPPEDE